MGYQSVSIQVEEERQWEWVMSKGHVFTMTASPRTGAVKKGRSQEWDWGIRLFAPPSLRLLINLTRVCELALYRETPAACVKIKGDLILRKSYGVHVWKGPEIIHNEWIYHRYTTVVQQEVVRPSSLLLALFSQASGLHGEASCSSVLPGQGSHIWPRLWPPRPITPPSFLSLPPTSCQSGWEKVKSMCPLIVLISHNNNS